MDKSKRRFSGNIPPETMVDCKRRKLLQPSINLGEDITTEILLRSPVKSILHFKSVSKLWLSILSSHRFRQIYASRQPKSAAATGLFLKFDRSNSLAVLPIDSHDVKPQIGCFVPSVKLPDHHWILNCTSSSNGLLLLRSVSKGSFYNNNKLVYDPTAEEEFDSSYYVYNPTTKEYKVIELPPHKNKYVCASLGFDDESIHYKVIFLWRQPEWFFRFRFRLDVYSSTTGTCSTVSTCSPLINHLVGKLDYDNVRGVFCNGAIHWLSISGALIVYFNVHTECINELPTPQLAVHYFGESQGHLHLVNSDHQHFYRSSVLYVNELERVYSGWFQKYKVEHNTIISALPCQSQSWGTFMSIFHGEEEDGDDSIMVFVTCDEWVEYNFKKKTLRRLCEYVRPELCTHPDPLTYWFTTHQFIPTFTSIC